MSETPSQTPSGPGEPDRPPQQAPDEPQRSREEIEADVIEALRTVYDPEIPVNIYELGLIYEIDVREDRSVAIRLTLTSPMCPVAGSLPPEVEAKAAQVPGVRSVSVDLVWEPPWNPGMMSEAARLELGFD